MRVLLSSRSGPRCRWPDSRWTREASCCQCLWLCGLVLARPQSACGCLSTGHDEWCPELPWVGTLHDPGLMPGLDWPLSDWRCQLLGQQQRPAGSLSWSLPSCEWLRSALARSRHGLQNGLRCHWTGWRWPRGFYPSWIRCAWLCRGTAGQLGTLLFLWSRFLCCPGLSQHVVGRTAVHGWIRSGQQCLETVRGEMCAWWLQCLCGRPDHGRPRSHCGSRPGLAWTRSGQSGLLPARGGLRGLSQRSVLRVHGWRSRSFWTGRAQSCPWQPPSGAPDPLWHWLQTFRVGSPPGCGRSCAPGESPFA